MKHEDLFDTHGLKKTRARLLILSCLAKSSYPLTAEELSKKLKDDEIDLSTIYRTLNTFAEKGICRLEVRSSKENVYSFIKDEDSHVLVCLKCGKRIILEGCPYHEVNERIEKETGFAIMDHNTEIYGLCPACLGKEA